MNKLLTVVALLVAACGGKSPATTNHANGAPEASASNASELDPTIPSWAPKSCVAYHKAAIEALDCDAIEQTKRDQIKQSYEAASVSWKAEENATPARIGEVDAACQASGDSVRAETVGHCQS